MTRYIKEELNMSTTPDWINGGFTYAQKMRYTQSTPVLMLLGMTANGHTLHTYMYIIVNNCIYFFPFVKRLELLDMCAIEIEDI